MQDRRRMAAGGTAGLQGELWSSQAADWADLMEPTQTPFHLEGLDAAGVGPGITLLDIGCGAGGVLRAAAARGAEVTGLDAAPVFAELVRERVPDARIVVGEMQDLPFGDAAFGVVTGFNSFQYAADPAAALREARRVLAPGGTLVTAIWGPAAQCEAGGVLGAVAQLAPAPPGTPGPFALAEDGALEALLAAGGLAAERIWDVDTPYVFPDEATTLRAFRSCGPVVRVERAVGWDAVRAALVRAIAPFRLPDGSYRMENVFRVATARAR
jgi:SAM-dependent methyltransferase